MRLTSQADEFGYGECTRLNALGRNESDEARTVFLTHFQQVLAVDLDGTRQGSLVTGQCTQEGGFSCSVLSEQGNQFALVQREVKSAKQCYLVFSVTVTHCEVMGRKYGIIIVHSQLKYWMRRRFSII